MQPADEATEARPVAEDQLYVELYQFYTCMELEGNTIHVAKAVYHHARATLELKQLARLAPPVQAIVPPLFDFEQPRVLDYIEYVLHRYKSETSPSAGHVLYLDTLAARCSTYLAPIGENGVSYAEMRLESMLRALQTQLHAFKAKGYVNAPASVRACDPTVRTLIWSVHALAWSIVILDPIAGCAGACNRARLAELHALLPTPQVQVQLRWPFFVGALAYLYYALATSTDVQADFDGTYASQDEEDADAEDDDDSDDAEEEEDDDDDDDNNDDEQAEDNTAMELSREGEASAAPQRNGDRLAARSTEARRELTRRRQRAQRFLARLARTVYDLYHNRREDDMERMVKCAYQCVS